MMMMMRTMNPAVAPIMMGSESGTAVSRVVRGAIRGRGRVNLLAVDVEAWEQGNKPGSNRSRLLKATCLCRSRVTRALA